VLAFNTWATNYSISPELVDILKKFGYDSLLSICTLKEEDVKSFKISPGASKKLLLAAQQVADKAQELKNNRKSVYHLNSQVDVDAKHKNDPWSPGTVIGANGYVLCVEPLQRGILFPAYFTCYPGGIQIIFNLVNTQQQAPVDFTIFALLSPSGKIYFGNPAGSYDGYYSVAGPAGNIVSMAILVPLYELGLWRVEVTPYPLPEENRLFDKNQLEQKFLEQKFTEKKLQLDHKFTETSFIVCNVISTFDSKALGKELYTLCFNNTQCYKFMNILGLPTQLPGKDDWDCSISKLMMGPFTLSLLFYPSPSMDSAVANYLFLANGLLGSPGIDKVTSKLIIETSLAINTKGLIFVLWFLCRSLGRCRY